MKQLLMTIFLTTSALFAEVAHEPKIDQIYWDKGWFWDDLYIRTDNQMWWKVLASECGELKAWKVGDGVSFSKYPFEHPCKYWLVNLNHFGGVIVEYQYELPPGFGEY